MNGMNEKLNMEPDKIHVFIAGDSTACDYPHEGENNSFPRTGWGQVFGRLFNDRVTVVNCALSGRSSKSFLCEENYKFMCNNIQKSDYLFIQFAHNDSKAEDLQRYTSPYDNSYQECIYKFINTARKVGAYPILCTSITRNLPSDTTLVPYGNALKKIGSDEDIPVIDLYRRTNSLLKDGIQDFYMRLEPRDGRFTFNPEFKRSQYYENGSTDNTHINIIGAQAIAKMAAEELRSINHPLAEYLI